MKNHDKDIKNTNIVSDKKLSMYKKFFMENLDCIKELSNYTKDTFIKINLKENTIQLLGGPIRNIFNLKNGLNEIDINEFLSSLDEISKIALENIINDEDNYDINELILIGKNKDNDTIWIRCILQKVIENGEDFSYIGVLNDMTEEILKNREYNKIIEYDMTTKVPNKYFMKDVVDNYLLEFEKNEEIGAFLLIDLDNFKLINDIFDHEVGDILLFLIADKLTSILNEYDIICRYSGDEFIIFKPNIKSVDEAESFAKEIINIFDEQLIVRGNQLNITASIGISIYPHNGINFNELLKSADTAVYCAKRNGKNWYKMFNSNLSIELERFYSIQRYLKNAISNDELFLLFQPNISLKDSKMHGMEALLRWNSKELGLVHPNEIIPVAESTRLILPIGTFILEEIFKKAKQLLIDGYENFKIAINLSEMQLRYNTVINDFEYLIRKYNIPPKYIEVEITESILMKSFDKNVKILNQIRDLGVSVALDDFGTGYSSLNYLTKLPIDVLKIDRSFVVDLMKNFKSRCIVENIINLSHKLGISVVAEGVEELEQVNYLKSINCDSIQGYYFSEPDEFSNIKNLFNKEFLIE